MAPIIHPTLACPFPSSISVHAETVQCATLAWVRRFQLARDDVACERISRRCYGELMARAYPHATLAALQLISDWNTWLFLLDDQCDETGLGKDPVRLAQLHARLLAVMRGALYGAQAGPQICALHDLTNRLLARAGERWLRRFSRQVELYFTANIWEATNRLHGTMPDVATYRTMRPFTGAVYTYLQLIEFVEQLDLPSDVRDHPDVQCLGQMTNNCICWSNDIISLEKELLHGDVHNLVLLLSAEQRLALQEAVDHVAALHDAEMRAFIALAARLPSFGAAADVELQRYVAGMRSWMRANLDWSAATARYRPATQTLQVGRDSRATMAENSRRILKA
jgi:Terpene synthase family 2, C-terminal metal binding